MYDIIIIGGGPAGLTAALYARRANKSVLVIEKGSFGGQITYSPKVENIPGFATITGNEFAEKLVEQVLEQGADVECAEVLSVTNGDTKTVHTDSGDFEGKSIIIATGAKHRMLGLEKEEQFVGEGISFCAVCDGAFYEGKTVAVIGGGNSALQEALLLSDLAKKIYVVQNLDYFTGEDKLVEQLKTKQNVEIILGNVVDRLLGENELEGIAIKNAAGEVAELKLDGMFVAIGLIPQNEPFSSLIKLNDWGYVDATENCLTDTDGIFVAGDCRSKKIRQVATAAADGAVAALAACDYIDR
ncbi:MAG: FAD-dependent oxidoreductase [Ruminococcaceae bacterium]|nr:FAD-dependent oxidoreductase [Oscillospiraceae bacterium]MBE6806366.1 FAD-dependent oxidoreductase [Oscillospiraceae bacterium]